MRWCAPALAAALLTAACVFDPSGVVRERDDGGVIDPDAPVGGIDAMAGVVDAAAGQPDAIPGTPDAPPGTPDAAPGDPDAGCIAECVGGQWRDCGMGGVLVDCPLGCVPTGTPHCGQLVPSNGADVSQLVGATGGLTLLSGEVGGISSDDGTVVIDGSVVRSAGNGVVSGIGFYPLGDGTAVLAIDSLTLEGTSRLRVGGGRGVIILSRGDVVLDGLLDVGGGCLDRAQRACAGPGAGAGSEIASPAGGCAPGLDGGGGAGIPEGGGGGGGFGGDGAKGGDGNLTTSLGGAGGSAGPPCAGASLVPLMGGSGGGRGFNPLAGNGGGGGGAVQLTSLTRITGTGTPGPGDPAGVWAGGAGGGGGGGGDGGGGGGSGGAILLEAPAIALTNATVTANGGGGGDGDGGGAGEYGTLATNPASGGGTAAQTRGGDGASLGFAAGEGGGVGDGAGGGGGGVGIVRFNVPAAGLDLTTTIVSPASTRGDPATE